MLRKWAVFFIFVAGALGGEASVSHAQTLKEAWRLAYKNYPALSADRSRQKATLELLDQAKSQLRPIASANGTAGLREDASSVMHSGTRWPASATITLSQPILKVKATSAIKQAQASIEAGAENTLALEQQVFLDVVAAYMDVIKSRALLRLQTKTVELFNGQLRDVSARFKVGEKTRTDLAQVQARLFDAKAQHVQAKAALEAAIAAYIRAVGVSPENLKQPTLPKFLPKNLDEALQLAHKINPSLLAARAQAQAADHAVGVAKGELFPEVSLNGEYGYFHAPGSGVSWSRSGSIYGSVSIPLYQGGLTYSKIRAARQTAEQKRFEQDDIREQVTQQVVANWNFYMATDLTIKSHKTQIEANRLALEGVEQEAALGTRTTLDVLNAERDLVDSEGSLILAQRDQVVSAYTLAASLGLMTAKNLQIFQ